jgi:hypothetical protein
LFESSAFFIPFHISSFTTDPTQTHSHSIPPSPHRPTLPPSASLCSSLREAEIQLACQDDEVLDAVGDYEADEEAYNEDFARSVGVRDEVWRGAARR